MHAWKRERVLYSKFGCIGLILMHHQINLATPTCEECDANTRAHSIHVFVQFICPHDYMIYPGIDTTYILYTIYFHQKKLYILFV